MVRVAAFSGQLVRPELAHRVVAPAPRGDARRAAAARDPLSFLHVIPPEEEEPSPAGLGVDALEACRARLERLVAEAFEPLASPAYLVHRIEGDGGSHLGVLGEVPVSEYVERRIHPHEDVRPSKVRRFTRSVRVIGASSTPIFLLAPSSERLSQVLRETAGTTSPVLDVTIADGSRQTLWRTSEPAGSAIAACLAEADLTIADGHHRSEAFAHVAEETEQEDLHLLAAIYPAEEVTTLGYHRAVDDLDGLGPDQVLHAVAERFEVEELADAPTEAPARGSIVMLLDRRWYRLRPTSGTDRLDVVVLHEELLDPVLGIDDPGDDERIGFVPGVRGPAEVAERCAAGGAGFLLPPIEVEEVVRAASVGLTLPPKSTWFEPKLPAGLAVRPLPVQDRGV